MTDRYRNKRGEKSNKPFDLFGWISENETEWISPLTFGTIHKGEVDDVLPSIL